MKAFLNIAVLIVVAYIVYYFYTTDVANAVPLTPDQLAKDTINTVKNAFSSITGKTATTTVPVPVTPGKITTVKPLAPSPEKPLTAQQQYDKELAEAITQVDNQIYKNIGWKEFNQAKLVADQSAPPPHKFGNLENQWEVVKWRIANSDGNTPPLPVPAQFTDYSLRNTAGQYYLPNFGVNYTYAVTNEEKSAVLSGFVSNWYYYKNYRPPTDAQAALQFVKLAVKMVALV